MDYTKVSVPAPLAERAGALITARHELGYRSVSELVTDQLRRFCETNEVHEAEDAPMSAARHTNGVLTTAPRPVAATGGSVDRR